MPIAFLELTLAYVVKTVPSTPASVVLDGVSIGWRALPLVAMTWGSVMVIDDGS